MLTNSSIRWTFLYQIPNQKVGESKKKRKEIPNQRVGESKKKRKKIPNQRMGESKKGREESSWSKKPEEMCREVFRPDNI